jgi:hypothetical protein
MRANDPQLNVLRASFSQTEAVHALFILTVIKSKLKRRLINSMIHIFADDASVRPSVLISPCRFVVWRSTWYGSKPRSCVSLAYAYASHAFVLCEHAFPALPIAPDACATVCHVTFLRPSEFGVALWITQ